MADGVLIVVEDNAEVVRQGLQNLARDIPQVGLLGIFRAAQRALTRLHNTSGSPSEHPVKWDSERQRKAFFASDGFSGGIPTQRTGQTMRDWQLVRLDNGYSLYNADDAASHVYGDINGKGQSSIHEGRWPLLNDIVIEEIEAHLSDDVIAELRLYGLGSGLEVL